MQLIYKGWKTEFLCAIIFVIKLILKHNVKCLQWIFMHKRTLAYIHKHTHIHIHTPKHTLFSENIWVILVDEWNKEIIIKFTTSGQVFLKKNSCARLPSANQYLRGLRRRLIKGVQDMQCVINEVSKSMTVMCNINWHWWHISLNGVSFYKYALYHKRFY